VVEFLADDGTLLVAVHDEASKASAASAKS